jgi:hypothetical protein
MIVSQSGGAIKPQQNQAPGKPATLRAGRRPPRTRTAVLRYLPSVTGRLPPRTARSRGRAAPGQGQQTPRKPRQRKPPLTCKEDFARHPATEIQKEIIGRSLGL